MSDLLSLLLSADLWASAIRLATPIAYAALAAMICERSGVTNIALEGMLLTSAFLAVLGSYFSDSAIIGVIAGIGGSLVLSGIFAWLVLTLAGDQIIIGAAINVAVVGLFGYVSFVLFRSPGVTPSVTGLDTVAVPFLSSVPWLGEVLFKHTPTVLFLPFAVVLCFAIVFRTPLGLRIRVAGEAPEVDEAAGVNVLRTRFTALMLAGAVVAFGGINLGLETLKFYQDSMVSGRGFIALAANIFGGWTALGGALASLLFGFSQALMFRVQIYKIPQEFIFMLPYILTLLVLLGAAGRKATAPAALGRAFRRQA
jgi:general nucleoside transport system permease protein